jgi:hypothetical protein
MFVGAVFCASIRANKRALATAPRTRGSLSLASLLPDSPMSLVVGNRDYCVRLRPFFYLKKNAF